MERRPYVQGNVLHESPLLLEGLLQARVGGLQVIDRHPSHYGHQSSPDLHLLLQPPILRRLRPKEDLYVSAPCYYLQAVPLESGLRL